MLSVVVEQPNQMSVRERPQPQPKAGEVRVRVRFAVASVEPSPAENRTNFQTGLTLPEEITTNLTWYDITSCLNVSPASLGS